jgi:hypothetical protein
VRTIRAGLQGAAVMETSILFAKFMGPAMLVSGIAVLVNRKNIHAVTEDFLNSPALIYLAGFLALLLGLAILIFHNVWVAGWPVIITIVGWIALGAGIVRMCFPALVKKIGTAMMERGALIMIASAFNTALGAFLTYMGFLG